MSTEMKFDNDAFETQKRNIELYFYQQEGNKKLEKSGKLKRVKMYSK